MKISGHTLVTNSETAGYPYLESIKSFANLCDEVIVVDGGSTDGSLKKIAKIPKVRIVEGEKWERDFDWTILAKNIQKGFEECKGDWAFHFDADYLFHEDNVEKMKKVLAETHMPAVELPKVNFIQVNENFVKDYYPLIVNKKEFKNVCYGIGIDMKGHKSATFLRPISKRGQYDNGIYYGDVVKMSNMRVHRENIGVLCYDFTFMTPEQIIEQRQRFDNALAKYLGKGLVSEKGSWKIFNGMMKYRHGLCKEVGRTGLKLEDHSKFIRDKVRDIKPDMFGYNMFNKFE